MAKKIMPAFNPTGECRPAKKGEWFYSTAKARLEQAWCDAPDEHKSDIYERREVEVEVEDEIPAWLDAALDKFIPRADRAPEGTGRIAQLVAAAFRAHVSERAKAAAKKIGSWDNAESIIVEEFTR